jgi:uncharacterized membrane protein YkoI
MKTVGRLAVAGIAFAGLMVVATPAWSEKKGEHEGNVAEMAKEAKVTVDQAIKTATEKVPGTVVEAELEKKHDKTIWEVEIVGADGTVSEVHIDTVAGTVIDVEKKKAEKKDVKKAKSKQ